MCVGVLRHLTRRYKNYKEKRKQNNGSLGQKSDLGHL
jgi:hypothetical protein